MTSTPKAEDTEAFGAAEGGRCLARHQLDPSPSTTAGVSPGLNAAVGDALDAMLTWLQAGYRVDKATVLAMAIPVADLRITQMAN
jgi:hypothetical protein